jgi:hypothetical protein
MARPKTLYSLLDVKKETGISYPTLVKYARDFAAQIPAVGHGRNRRYTAESIRAFQRIYAKRTTGRKPGADWVKYPPDAEAVLPGQGGGPVQLAEEDRELLRNVLEALREVSAKLEAFSEAAGLRK